MNQYSKYFETLYDEQFKVGQLGNGTHYSVLRALVWHDQYGEMINFPKNLDFVVIWDNDHDERVIKILEELYIWGRLSVIKFIGEYKGILSLLLNLPDLGVASIKMERLPLPGKCKDVLPVKTESIGEVQIGMIISNCESVIRGFEDLWTIHVNYMPHIILDERIKVEQYLNTIDMLWNLGVKEL